MNSTGFTKFGKPFIITFHNQTTNQINIQKRINKYRFSDNATLNGLNSTHTAVYGWNGKKNKKNNNGSISLDWYWGNQTNISNYTLGFNNQGEIASTEIFGNAAAVRYASETAEGDLYHLDFIITSNQNLNFPTQFMTCLGHNNNDPVPITLKSGEHSKVAGTSGFYLPNQSKSGNQYQLNLYLFDADLRENYYDDYSYFTIDFIISN